MPGHSGTRVIRGCISFRQPVQEVAGSPTCSRGSRRTHLEAVSSSLKTEIPPIAPVLLFAFSYQFYCEPHFSSVHFHPPQYRATSTHGLVTGGAINGQVGEEEEEKEQCTAEEVPDDQEIPF